MVEARLWTSKDDRRERQVRSCWNQMPQPWEPTLSLLPVTHTELPRVRCSPKQFNSEAYDEQIACELVLPKEHCPGIAISRGNGKHQLWEFTHELLGLGIYLFPAYWLLCHLQFAVVFGTFCLKHGIRPVYTVTNEMVCRKDFRQIF